MNALLNTRGFYLFTGLFLLANLFLISRDEYILCVLPIALLLVYTAFFHFDKIFYLIIVFTPLSINIEEFVGGDIGLFLPTEPLLFGMLILIIYNQMRKNQFETEFIKHPITIIFILQLIWIFITCITSELPLVSFKFLLTKLWFIVPIYFYGYVFFKKEGRIKWFAWLFIGSMSVVALYTLTNHAIYGFDEETGHWVMWPFFKDHTSYGAILALVYPILFGLFYIHRKQPITRAIIVGLILMLGFAIIMSYTRAAWASLVGALVVYLLIRFKIKFRYLAIAGLAAGIYVAASWTDIMHNLEKNRSEHATEDMNERLESMTNVTTDASNLERLNRWGSAIRMWQERPIV